MSTENNFDAKNVVVGEELNQSLRFFNIGEGGSGEPDIVEGQILHLRALDSYDHKNMDGTTQRAVEFLIYETGETVRTTHSVLGGLLERALEGNGNLRIVYNGLAKGSSGRSYHSFEGFTFNLK